jgi:NLR family CARD domain-containing protein 3
MQYGSLAVFFGGLEALKGPPLLLRDTEGFNTIREGMRVEHCERADHTMPFSTSNGMEGATSALEWEFVVEPVLNSSRYVERGGDFPQLHPEWCRIAKPLSSFTAAFDERNARLAKGGHVPLAWDELVAGRLYTGPMYEKVGRPLIVHVFFAGYSLFCPVLFSPPF